MKLFGLLLLLVPQCLSRSHPRVGRTAPAEPRFPFALQQHNLPSLEQSVAEIKLPSALGSRAARANFPETEEQKLVSLGCSLIGMMSTRDFVAAHFIRPARTHTTAESPWTDYHAFSDWGWRLNVKRMSSATTAMIKYLDPVMRDLGLPELNVPEDGGTAEPRILDHRRTTTHDGIEYKATGAKMDFLMDVHHGMIMAMVTYGPSHQGSLQIPPVTVLPKLKSLYDIMFLQYAQLATERNQQVSGLKHLFVYDVQNDDTKTAVNFALGEMLDAWECDRFLWPGKAFHPDDDGYRAIIGSPNGRSMALLLITHKSIFGERRMIESITVFCQHPDRDEFNLYFKVKDHEEEDDDTDWTDEEESENPGQPAFSVSSWPRPTPTA